MSFTEEIYPYRSNKAEFIRRLRVNLYQSWTQVSDIVRSSDERPGFIARCQVSSPSLFQSRVVECNYHPTILDKKRVNALLKAWARQISDRYLDLNLVRIKEVSSLSTMQIAFDNIRRNKSAGGAVSFIMNELEWERTNNNPTFFGQNMFSNYNYNTYFTHLLYWGDLHCYGLIRELQMQEARHHGAGGSSIHPVWQAARNWLLGNKDKGVYKDYNLQF